MKHSGDTELLEAKRGAFIVLSTYTNYSDRKIAREEHVSKTSMVNARKRALENDKKNIEPYSNCRPRLYKEKPLVISNRDTR